MRCRGLTSKSLPEPLYVYSRCVGLHGRLKGTVYKYDISLPLPRLYEPVEVLSSQIGDMAINCCGYGHLGDGNLHLNITAATHSDELLEAIESYVYPFTAEVNGSISAEHGLGILKAQKLHYSKSPEAVATMQRVKQMLDPSGILNPYKTITVPASA